MTHRHAIYFAPDAAHPLWHAGCAWLGRDARAGQPLHPPASDAVREAWRYGFHATLKAPMRLRDGATEAALLQALQVVAERTPAFDMPPLQVGWLDRFIALRPAVPVAADHPLRRVADACVAGLDTLRAPMTPAERERYLRAGLSERQREQVQRWGYAHVLEDWRFHLTISKVWPDPGVPEAGAMCEAARHHFAAALARPLRFDALCVFVEPAPGEPFVLTRRIALPAA
jgi:hypothetical protein